MRTVLVEGLRQRYANYASNANLGAAFHGHSTNYKLNSTNKTLSQVTNIQLGTCAGVNLHDAWPLKISSCAKSSGAES